MIIRMALLVSLVSFITGCFNGMRVGVAPPECTVDERSAKCTTAPKVPAPMTEENFFLEKSELMDYWNEMA